jgi:hypothetical protein
MTRNPPTTNSRKAKYDTGGATKSNHALTGRNGRMTVNAAVPDASAVTLGCGWLANKWRERTIYLGQSKVAIDRPNAELAEIERWRTKSLEHS